MVSAEKTMRSSEKWRRGRLLSAGWDVVIKTKPIYLPYGLIFYGTDYRRMAEKVAELSEIAPGHRVLDVPCGGGVAFRGLRSDQRLDYVAADISPTMLRRAESEAARRGLPWIAVREADVRKLPFEAREFDTCLTYNGIQCFPDPAASIREMARVLRPGGELRGSSIVRGTGPWRDMRVSFWCWQGSFGHVPSATELSLWLTQAGLGEIQMELSGAVAYFTARRLGD